MKARRALLACAIAVVLWYATNAVAMPAQGKIIIEDNSGPWLAFAALITVVGGVAAPLFLRRRKK